MNICACEIQKKYPESASARMDMLVELDRRGLLKSKFVRQHGTQERVWERF